MSAPPSASGTVRERSRDRSVLASHLHRIAPLLLVALGLLALFQARDMGLGELTAPGPGLWPFLVAVLLTGTAAVLVFVDPAEDYEPWTPATVRIMGGLVSLGLFIVLFEALGFIIPAFLMLALWLRVFGREPWRWSLGLAVAGAVLFHLLFVEALGVPFPEGVLEPVLGG
ncbi:tripartite tricarboxylate transporter TctB family protein [Geodermatophilus sp. DF01-2]|uniref:tripartite tricarboxylate transporter TctB family protein n=1 Tax=Geodermatophilus sp. DF01-2 TaxID=2559610 RepID=UPI0010739BCE|nr:tripartite tricarboxylate transporter TctB family protein [Geodermatophilus sp. DF01_2]TFV60130.1 tripartite tricarboxylate transporter TctB family protein [Geodermatophilus sp. DF01_2]